jgi:hypothetical protein
LFGWILLIFMFIALAYSHTTMVVSNP